MDSLIAKRYYKTHSDTAYYIRPLTKLTLTGRLNISGAVVEMEGNEQGIPFHSKMTSDYKSTLSMGVSYLGITLNLALNPAKLLGKYKDFELNLNSYSNKWGFDFIYQNAHNFTGWYEGDGSPRISLPSSTLKLESLNINTYYAFNHRRFSYPAAFSQTYIQRRSAGSFLVGVSGQGQRAKTNGAYESILKVTNIGIGAGYGYNWVPKRNWLLHLSALPTFTVFSHSSLTVKKGEEDSDNKVSERIPIDYRFPEVIIAARGAIVRQIGNMFAGVTMVYNFTNIGDRDELAIHNSKWRARLFLGYRL